jgi:hypothetical protein
VALVAVTVADAWTTWPATPVAVTVLEDWTVAVARIVRRPAAAVLLVDVTLAVPRIVRRPLAAVADVPAIAADPFSVVPPTPAGRSANCTAMLVRAVGAVPVLVPVAPGVAMM